MKNKLLLLISALVLFLITDPVNAEETVIRKKYGSYTVSIYQSFETYFQKVVIQKNKKKIYELSEFGTYYYFGNNFDDTNEGKDPYSGRDITGNGVPNLVISEWNGGAHCCNSLHIFELGKEFKKVATITGYSSRFRIVNLDQDKSLEIEFCEGAIDYVFASYAFSPCGRTILKYKSGNYVVSVDLMKRKMIPNQKLRKIKRKIKTEFAHRDGDVIPYSLLKVMMDLSYSGHLNSALQVADECWPLKTAGLKEFKDEFVATLQSDTYWSTLN